VQLGAVRAPVVRTESQSIRVCRTSRTLAIALGLTLVTATGRIRSLCAVAADAGQVRLQAQEHDSGDLGAGRASQRPAGHGGRKCVRT
jgi:hypothetical protein